MGRRTLLLLAALVLAALGTTGVFLYVNSVDERAAEGNQVVSVLVATEAIPPGTTVRQASEEGFLDQREFLRRSLAGLDTRSSITGMEDQEALATIAEGQPIQPSQFGPPGQSNQPSLAEGDLAVSVELDDPARVAALVGAGSRVAVFVTGVDGGGQSSTRLLLEDVTVIAAGATTVDAGAEPAGEGDELTKALLTLAVDQVEAQKIIYASQNGQLHLGLLGGDSTVNISENGTDAANLFDQP